MGHGLALHGSLVLGGRLGGLHGLHGLQLHGLHGLQLHGIHLHGFHGLHGGTLHGLHLAVALHGHGNSTVWRLLGRLVAKAGW